MHSLFRAPCFPSPPLFFFFSFSRARQQSSVVRVYLLDPFLHSWMSPLLKHISSRECETGTQGLTLEAGRRCPSPEHAGPVAARVVRQSSVAIYRLASVCLSSRGSR